MSTPDGFEGRAAIVSGGASGIGEATASLLVRAGAHVVLLDIDGDALPQAQERTGAAAIVKGDVKNAADVERMIAEATRSVGPIELAFNSAGIGDDLVPVHKQTPDRWQHILDVNLRGTYLVCREAARQMLETGKGSIVNVASIVGLGAFPGRSAYGAAKAGIMHLTQTLACEWGPRGIRVNAIAPAYTRTPMVAKLMERKVFDPTLLEERTPLGRLAEVDEVANAGFFLLSERSSFITGAVLPVDGGWSVYGSAGPVDSIRSGPGRD